MLSIMSILRSHYRFYDCVMSAPTSSGQNVLSQLQQTFAFLRHSMRAVYSPADFVKASRPPWFEPGRQQDCSEFLRFVLFFHKYFCFNTLFCLWQFKICEIYSYRYLLDTLHEQEKRSLGLSGLTSVPRDHRIKRKESDEDPESENGSVKPSCSTNALDAISEAPEDEDMISQVTTTYLILISASTSHTSRTYGLSRKQLTLKVIDSKLR